MTGRMIEFDANGSRCAGLSGDSRKAAAGPGVVVLHEWWGLTEPFRQVCDGSRRRASSRWPLTSIVARRPTKVEEAEALSAER